MLAVRRVTDFGVVITPFVGLKAIFFDKRQADAFPPDFFLKAVAERCFNLFAEERDLASRKVYSPGKPLELTAKGKESEVVLTGQPGGDLREAKRIVFTSTCSPACSWILPVASEAVPAKVKA
jgi:hypothetical protein